MSENKKRDKSKKRATILRGAEETETQAENHQRGTQSGIRSCVHPRRYPVSGEASEVRNRERIFRCLKFEI